MTDRFAYQIRWKSAYRPKEEKVVGNPKEEKTTNNYKNESKPSTSKDNIIRNCDIQYFRCQGRGRIASQCPNRQTMLL